MKKLIFILLFCLFSNYSFAQYIPSNGVGSTSGVIFSGTPLLGYVPIATSPTTAIWAPLLGATPQSFGAKCDGTTDDTIALNAWLATFRTGVSLALPAGTCVFTSALSIGTLSGNVLGASITGVGEESILRYTGASTTIDLLTIGAPGTIFSINQPLLSGFRLASSTTMTAGNGIVLYKYGRGTVQQVLAEGQDGAKTLWNGFSCQGCNDINLLNSGSKAQNDVFLTYSIIPTAGGCFCGPVYVTGGKYNSGANGFHLAGLAAVTLSAVDVIANNHNVLIDTSQATACNCVSTPGNQLFVLSKDGFLDSSVSDNILINDAGLSIGNKFIDLSGAIATSGATNINVQLWNNGGAAAQIAISSPQIADAQTDGVLVQDTLTQVVIEPAAYINNNGISATGYGVNCSSSTTNVAVLTQFFASNTTGNIAANCNNSINLPGVLNVNSPRTTFHYAESILATVAGNYVRQRIVNNSTANNSTAGTEWDTGVANAFANATINNGGGTPFFVFSTGSAVPQMFFSPLGVNGLIVGPGVQVGASPTGGDKGAGSLNVAGTIWTNGTQGLASKSCVAATATLTITNGLITATSGC